MEISVRAMDESEFREFRRSSAEVYIANLMTQNISREEAEARSNAENAKILPNGLQTPNALFLTVLGDAKNIGYFWFELREKNGMKSVFTYAFEMYPPGKGHGYAAMVKAKDFLRGLGVSKVNLHVFTKNKRAIELYQAVGFETVSCNMTIAL